MSPGWLRLFWLELFDVARRPSLFVGLFAVPIVLMSAIGSFGSSATEYRVLLVNLEEELASLRDTLGEMTQLTLVASDGEHDLRREMSAADADIAIVLDQGLQFYERSATQLAQRRNLQTILQMEHVLEENEPWFTPNFRAALEGQNEPEPIYSLVLAPGAENRIFAPRLLALIIIILPTVVAARSYLREVSNGTLPLLLTIPGGGWPGILSAKLAAVMLIALAVFCLLLLSLSPLFGFFIKPDLAEVLLACLLAMITSACLGITLMMIARDTIIGYLYVALFLVANLVFTGLLAPIDAAYRTVVLLSYLFPLTFLGPVLEEWLFYGASPLWNIVGVFALSTHTVIATGLLILSTSAVRRSL